MRWQEPVGRLALRWVDRYTAALPSDVAEQRRAEIRSDLWEHRAWAERAGHGDLATAAAIVWRVMAGIPADLRWRRDQLVAAGTSVRAEGQPSRASVRHNWWIVLAGVLAVFQLVAPGPLMASMADGMGNAPLVLASIAVLSASGFTTLIGIGRRRRRRAEGDLLIAIGMFPALSGSVSAAILVASLGWWPSLQLLVPSLWAGMPATVAVLVVGKALADRAQTWIDGRSVAHGRAVRLWQTVAATLVGAVPAALLVGSVARVGPAPALLSLVTVVPIAVVGARRLRGLSASCRVGVVLVSTGTWAASVIGGTQLFGALPAGQDLPVATRDITPMEQWLLWRGATLAAVVIVTGFVVVLAGLRAHRTGARPLPSA